LKAPAARLALPDVSVLDDHDEALRLGYRFAR
jgi:hypothetical protein